MRVAILSRKSPSCVTISIALGQSCSSSASQRARLCVEVVGGLVQEHVLGPPDEHLRQRDAHLPATAEVAAKLLVVASFESEAIEHLADARLDAITVVVVEVVEEARLLVDQRVEVALAALRSCAATASSSLLDRARLRERQPQLLQERVVVVEPGFLAQVAERAVAEARFAVVRLLVAREQAQDGGFTAAVRANEAHVLAVAHDKREVNEDVDGAKRPDDIICVEHSSSGWPGLFAGAVVSSTCRGKSHDRAFQRAHRRA